MVKVFFIKISDSLSNLNHKIFIEIEKKTDKLKFNKNS